MTEVNKVLPEPLIQGIIAHLSIEPVDRAAAPGGPDKSSAAQSGIGARRTTNSKPESPHAEQPATPSKRGTGAAGLGNFIEAQLFEDVKENFRLGDGNACDVHLSTFALIAPTHKSDLSIAWVKPTNRESKMP